MPETPPRKRAQPDSYPEDTFSGDYEEELSDAISNPSSLGDIEEDLLPTSKADYLSLLMTCEPQIPSRVRDDLLAEAASLHPDTIGKVLQDNSKTYRGAYDHTMRDLIRGLISSFDAQMRILSTLSPESHMESEDRMRQLCTTASQIFDYLTDSLRYRHLNARLRDPAPKYMQKLLHRILALATQFGYRIPDEFTGKGLHFKGPGKSVLAGKILSLIKDNFKDKHELKRIMACENPQGGVDHSIEELVRMSSFAGGPGMYMDLTEVREMLLPSDPRAYGYYGAGGHGCGLCDRVPLRTHQV
ncbi:hypothetical protein B0T20DRAFT_396293 [Sordaria brevicollis]|uniref:Uncharacterized protein n=1 Tax=Sordaria brevicollis TaxID=83679 RepID=A0AAE0U6R1_SORBR|nr:hypothetical protein B0T20DRAFT_396293 [Sordaria brevicollis]